MRAGVCHTVFLSLAVLVCHAATLRGGESIEVKVVKYAGLADVIRSNKGKVVVVDFWADWCVPCKREFPNLVRLAEKYARDGLVAVSVSLDDPHDEKAKGNVLKFLRTKKASFTNLILDESSDSWTKKFETSGPPFTYVFDRQGKWRRFQGADHYAEIEKLVLELLKQK